MTGSERRPAAPRIGVAEQGESHAPMAAIEIGSTGVRVLVASLDASGVFKVLDRAGKPSRIGRDVFTLGRITREGMHEVVAVLSSFRELLKGYGIEPGQVRTIGTSALREASNRDTFVDRISLQTGFAVRVLEDIEEHYLMYLAVQEALQDELRLMTRSNAMILEVGGGTTAVMLLRRGKMAATHSLRIGTLRLDERMRGAGASREYLREYLESNVRNACDLLDDDLPLDTVKTFILIGSDARFAAYCLSGKTVGAYTFIDRARFAEFSETISALSTEECVATYGVPWAEAEGLASGLTIERMFLDRTGADSVLVPDVSMREGLLLAELRGPDPEAEAGLQRQVIASAYALGRRFRYDETHARTVAALSLSLFDFLCKEQGMGGRDRLLLEVAAVLHDIGTYIRASGHHKHGEYIVANSEIFGMNHVDLTVVASVIRYHRKAPPVSTHVNFISLPREDRILVMKLAAMLRVADALDRGHDGRVGDVSFERGGDRFVIRAAETRDFSLERLSLAGKGDMFEDVFGMRPVLAGEDS